ncbi:MAG: acyl-CoA dehydrogenase family protein, partial [Verrucomicrobiae bacterium]|nr:acyl-CoA dehydrogenase family protein [Verrucomicrobiae bacterium]
MTDAEIWKPRELELIRAAESFCRDEVAPNAADWDRAEALPREIFSRAGELRLLAITAESKWGGQGQR